MKRKNSRQREATRTWKGLSVNIKAAIIGGILAGFCAIFAALISIYPVVKAMQERSVLPELVCKELLFFPKYDLISNLDNHYVVIMPTVCWMWKCIEEKYNGLGGSVVPRHYIEAIFDFLLTSDKPVVIKDIRIVLDRYSMPYSQHIIKKGNVSIGMGGAGVSAFRLQSIKIAADFNQGSLMTGEVYQLKKNDAIVFSTLLTFLEPGEYSFHIEVEVQTFNGDEMTVESKPSSFEWFFLDDLTSINITERQTKATVTIVRSKCK